MAKITIFVPEQDPIKLGFDDQEKITLGRAPENDVVVEHASISGNHAVFELVDGRYNLSDLGSTNGTFVEGSAIATDAPLANGMKILFGTVEADYESEEEPAETGESEEAAGEDTFGDSESGYGGQTPVATIAGSSARPSGFSDLSPIEKFEKKDQMGQIAMLVGVIGILAAVGLLIAAAVMEAS